MAKHHNLSDIISGDMAKFLEEQRVSMRFLEDLAASPGLQLARVLMAGPSMEAVRQMIDSPGLELMRSLNADMDKIPSFAQAFAAQPLFEQMQREITAWNTMPEVEGLAQRSIDILGNLQHGIFASVVTDQALSSYRELASSLSSGIAAARLLEPVWQVEVDALTPALASIMGGIEHAFSSADYRQYFVDSFAGDLLEQLNEADVADTPEQKVRALAGLLVWLQSRMRKYKVSPLVLVALHSIIFDIIVPRLIDEYFDMPAIVEHNGDMNARFDELEREVKKLGDTISAYQATVIAHAPHHRLYNVTKPLRVRTEPSTDAKLVSIVPQNTVVEQIGQRGRWLHIEYFDYVDGELNRGWVYRRNMVLIAPFNE